MTEAALFVVLVLAAFSPWLIKNVFVTGNPVFPLLQGLFDGGGWDGAARARWSQAHPPGIAEPGRLAGQLRDLFLGGGELPALILSPAAFVFLPLVLFVRKRRRLALTLLGYVALCLGLWLLFTHRIQRFLVPTLAVSVALSAGGAESLQSEGLRRVLRGLTAFLLALSLFMTWPYIPRLWAEDLRRQGVSYLGVSPVWYFAELLPPGERMLSVGEARSLYFGPNVHTETVFDPKLLDGLLADDPEPEELARRLKERGFAYIFVNWWELSRLQATYAYEYGGRRHAGYSERITSTLFQRLEDAGAITAARAWGPSVYTVETPEGWRYPPPTKPALGGAGIGDEAVVAFHPAVYEVYRIEGHGSDD